MGAGRTIIADVPKVALCAVFARNPPICSLKTMSAPLAGKFQDHYAILGIDPKSDSETIQQAYSRLAQKYHPNNAATGSAEMFEAVNAAYETLSDPDLRFVFDRVKGVGQDEGGPKFSGDRVL